MDAPKPVYDDLLKLVADKDYFVITTNVDHWAIMAYFSAVSRAVRKPLITKPRFVKWSGGRRI